jgi:hypothetical protein
MMPRIIRLRGITDLLHMPIEEPRGSPSTLLPVKPKPDPEQRVSTLEKLAAPCSLDEQMRCQSNGEIALTEEGAPKAGV